jgi:2-polyprenyl-3-methyl-5-hydroxy-6-metoxy-1,4-benzoquinol methylase
MCICADNNPINHIKVKEINGFELFECRICHHRFAKVDNHTNHTEKYYNDAYFFEGQHGGYPGYFLEKKILINRGIQYASLLKKSGIEPGFVLDVGGAAGFILKGFIEEGWDGILLEPNQSMVTYARDELGLHVFQGTLDKFESEKVFDCILMIQVISHLYDMEKNITKVKELLKENGTLVIETWDRNSLTARILGWKWHEYCPPTVLHWFAKSDLIHYLQNKGFHVQKKGRLLKKIKAKHAKSILQKRFKCKFIHKIISLITDDLTFTYPSEDLFYIILKKSI